MAKQTKAKAEAAREATRAEAQAPAQPWPQVFYPPDMPEERAGIRHIGERVMRILGAEFCANPRPDALDGLADEVGWAMIEHLEQDKRPKAREAVEAYCARVEQGASSPKGLQAIKDRVSRVLVPF